MRFHRGQLLRILSFAFGSSFILSRESEGYSSERTIRKRWGVGTSSTWESRSHHRATGVRFGSKRQAPTIFAPFPETSNYFGDAHKVWMVNFRVRDLDKMAAQLQAAGIAVKIDPQSSPIGRFARLYDPEGNPIELWQPAGPNAPR